MMNKVNAACHSLAAGTRKNVFERLSGQQVQPANNKRPKPSSPSEVFVIGKPGTTVEVFVTTDGRKSGSNMVSSRKSASAASKVTEDSHTNNWSKTLRDQSRPAMKQGLQQLAAQTHSSRHNRHENSERKHMKTSLESHKSQKCPPQDNRILDEIPVKQPARKPVENLRTAPTSAVPSTTTMASSMESVEVSDRGVQCGGIFDRTNDRFSAFDPVRTIGFLMKEMEGLVRDDRSSKILTDMEQALLRVPMENGKSVQVDLDVLTLRAQLDATTAKLAETSAKIESTCAAQREEIEALLQQVNKQAVMLEDAKQREKTLESEAKQMRLDLNEALKSAAESRRTITHLQQENKSIQITEKMIADLRRELHEQIELAEHRFMEVQYLQLEREKFMTLSSYKDSKLIELRAALKELQNHISEQLINIREAGKRAQDAPPDYQPSVIVGGAACSSPTSSCSINSLVQASVPEVSEISLSTVDCFTNSVVQLNKPPSKTQVPTAYFNGLLDESEVGRPCDKTQLEFISLPGGESLHAISLSHRKDEEGNLLAASHNKKDELPTSDRKVEGFHSVPNLGGKNTRDSLHRVDRENKDTRPKSKTRKSTSLEKRRSGDMKSLSNREEDKRASIDRASGDPPSIKQHIEMMFEDIRQQSKLPVHVPSPPRELPRPDWSDSSFPTLSGISDSNIV